MDRFLLRGAFPLSRLLRLAFTGMFFLALTVIGARASEKLDIVPMPKEIRLQDQELVMDPERVVLVLGENPSPQSRKGAAWINQRLVEMGGKALKVENGADVAPGVVSLIIGTLEEQPLLRETGGLLTVAPGVPGERGYEIRHSPDGKRVYLAGVDPVGSLYACVTAGELLKQQGEGKLPVLRLAEVRDWPDIQHVMLMPGARGTAPSPWTGALARVVSDRSDSEALREACLAEFRETYDDMLRRKISMFLVYGTFLKRGELLLKMSPHARETMRLGFEMGQEYGIHSMFYSGYSFVGLREEHPLVNPDLLVKDAYERTGRYKKWVRSWSMDEERRAFALRMARAVQASGFTDFAFHDTDYGLPDNPAIWDARGKRDQERWGDDYGAAVINLYQIYAEAFAQEAPGTRLHFTIMPYIIDHLGETPETKMEIPREMREAEAALKEKTLAFWQRVDKALPPSITFCIREAPPEAVKAFRDNLPGRSILIWYAVYSDRFFNNAPAWLKTFYRGNPGDVLFTGNEFVDHGYIPLIGLALREYSWNTETSGAALFPERSRESEERNDHSTAAFRVVLPRLVRNAFGEALAPDVEKAVSQDVSPLRVFGGGPRRRLMEPKDTTPTRLKEWKERSLVARKAMDRAWATLHDPARVNAAERRALLSQVAFLRELYATTAWMATLREEFFLAQELANQGENEKAVKAMERGIQSMKDADEDLLKLENLKLSHEGWPKTEAYAASTFRKEQLGVKLPQMYAAGMQYLQAGDGGLTRAELKSLKEENGAVKVLQKTPPVIDGKVDPTEWEGAYPMETWFEGGARTTATRFPARFLTLRDNDYLYVAFRAPLNGRKPDREAMTREFIRIYLNTGQGDVDVWEIFSNGSIWCHPQNAVEDLKFVVRILDNAWEGECAIRLARYGKEGVGADWRINFVRGYGDDTLSGVNSILPWGDAVFGSFHSLLRAKGGFPMLVRTVEPFKPELEVTPSGGRLHAVTVEEGIMTELECRVEMKTNVSLETVTAEALVYGKDGSLQGKSKVTALGRVNRRHTLESIRVLNGRPLSEGVLHLVVVSEGRETVRRFDFRLSRSGKDNRLEFHPLP